VLLTCNFRIKNIPGREGEVSAKKKEKGEEDLLRLCLKEFSDWI
jgi:hypothetical protein